MQHSQKGSAAILTKSPHKNKLQEDRKRKETINQRISSFKIRLQKKRQSGPSDANVSVIRGEPEVKRKKRASESLSSDPEDCEEPSFVETGEENSDIDAECFSVQGCILKTDAAKSGSNAQNATSGAMKSVWVQTSGKRPFAFSATLNKCSARLPKLQYFAKHICTNLSEKLFSFDSVIKVSFLSL
jgi:hypothetical protein